MSTNHGKTHETGFCVSCFEKLSEYIDNELGDAGCSEVRQHLEHCVCCSACFKTLRKTIELSGCLEDAPVPEGLSNRLKQILFLN